jgi:uncharacterized protein YabN with tetrapyrrole methylase and pyrophosphatase domain
MRTNNPLDESLNIGIEDRSYFDWPDVDSVFVKVDEELLELKTAKSIQDQFHEIGDVLFTLVQVARHLKIDPSLALDIANLRYKKRTDKMKTLLQDSKIDFQNSDLNLLETYWKKAKKLLKSEEALDIQKALSKSG